MAKCLGRKKDFVRCEREAGRKLFCHHHRNQPYLWVSFLVFTVGAGVVTLISGFLTFSEFSGNTSTAVAIEEVNLLKDVPSYRVSFLTLDGWSLPTRTWFDEDEVFLVPNRIYSLLKEDPHGLLNLYNAAAPFLASVTAPDAARVTQKFLEDPLYRFSYSFPTPHLVGHSNDMASAFPNYEIVDGTYSSSHSSNHGLFCPWEAKANQTGLGPCDLKAQGGDRSPCPTMAGFIGLGNLNSLIGRYVEFPDVITWLAQKNPTVPDLLAEELFVSQCDGDLYLSLKFRPPKVLALDIENISKNPIPISSIEGVYHLREHDELSKWPSRDERTLEADYEFPPGWLAPNEHLRIPVGLILGSFSDHLDLPDSASFSEAYPSSRVSLDGQNWIDFPGKPASLSLSDEYLLGTWFEVRSINGGETIREFDPSKIVYNGSRGIGSCPFAYVVLEGSQDWVEIGTLISENNGKSKEGISILAVPETFDGRLLIKEIEPETSYLDRVVLIGESETGELETILPSDERLRHSDGEYLTLRQGEEVLLKFEIGTKTKRHVVLSQGFFVPTETPNPTTPDGPSPPLRGSNGR